MKNRVKWIEHWQAKQLKVSENGTIPALPASNSPPKF
jgi:hypothetical protein